MIIFKTVSYKNFFSSGNFPIKINLEENPSTIIIGHNGAGKSTFLSAICYALYGEPYKKVLKGGIINSINKKDMLVELDFRIGQNEYKIRRGMKPNIFELYENDKLKNIDSISNDYQDYLTKYVLKMSFHTFKQIVVIGNSGFIPFLKLPAGQRREMMEDVLDLSIFTKMNVLLKSDLLNKKDEIESFEKLLYQTKIKKETSLDKLNFVNQKLNNDLTEKHKEIQIEIDKKTEQLNKIPTEFPDFENELSILQNKATKINRKEAELTTEISFLKKERELLNHDNCPTCKREIDSEFKICKSSELDTIIKEKIELNTNVKRALNALNLKISEISTKITKLNQLVRLRENLENEVHFLKAKISEKENSDEFINIKSIEIEIDELNTEYEKLTEQKAKTFKEIENINQGLIVLKDNGVKSKIIKTYIPLINQFINEYLEQMNYYVLFEIDENFDETIKSRHRDIFTYDNFSDGEKSRIDLAFLFAWRKIAKLRNGIATNLLILDEVFSGSLDETGIEDLNLILKSFVDSNVFVITHRVEGTIEKFDSIIEFKKEKNFSNIYRNNNALQT